ncbi:MAG: hypothetical protein KC432_11575 [Thermomicrobiales bacterium]|nr:hypothetical protein [Thermomicrobiales bacterium]
MDLHYQDANALPRGRRSALRAVGLGVAALGALPLLADSADAKKRGRKKKSGKVTDRCLPQVAECEAVATTFCANASDKDLCQQTLSACCQSLGTCNGGQSIQCVINAFTQKV